MSQDQNQNTDEQQPTEDFQAGYEAAVKDIVDYLEGGSEFYWHAADLIQERFRCR